MDQARKQRSQVDKDYILRTFAEYLERLTNISADTYLNDYQLLDEKINEHKAELQWDEMASKIGMDRWRLYHWFFETFERSLAGGMSPEDMSILRHEVHRAVQRGVATDKQFQNELKQKLAKQYHRSTFSIAFNNARRAMVKVPRRSMQHKLDAAKGSEKRSSEDNDATMVKLPPIKQIQVSEPIINIPDQKTMEIWGKSEEPNNKTQQLIAELLGERHDEPHNFAFDYPFEDQE